MRVEMIQPQGQRQPKEGEVEKIFQCQNRSLIIHAHPAADRSLHPPLDRPPAYCYRTWGDKSVCIYLALVDSGKHTRCDTCPKSLGPYSSLAPDTGCGFVPRVPPRLKMTGPATGSRVRASPSPSGGRSPSKSARTVPQSN